MQITQVLDEQRRGSTRAILERTSDFEGGQFILKIIRRYGSEDAARKAFDAEINPKKGARKSDSSNKRRS